MAKPPIKCLSCLNIIEDEKIRIILTCKCVFHTNCIFNALKTQEEVPDAVPVCPNQVFEICDQL